MDDGLEVKVQKIREEDTRYVLDGFNKGEEACSEFLGCGDGRESMLLSYPESTGVLVQQKDM